MIKYTYKMLKRPTGDELMVVLEKYISEGWMGFGSPFFGVEGTEGAFYVAVMKIKSAKG